MTSAGSVEADARIRLFCALQLPDPVLDRIVAWQLELAPGDYRLVPRENLHLTLAFLGCRPADELEAIGAELEAAAKAADPIELRMRRYRETRSVGMLVFDDQDETAGRIADDLHARLEQIGVYEREQRSWLPHLTVVRFRERPRLSPEIPDFGPVVPSGAAVYLSRLRSTGAEYLVVQEARLGG
jgi:RNA 2',3'-cyclic 3'-phosphodiesterase